MGPDIPILILLPSSSPRVSPASDSESSPYNPSPPPFPPRSRSLASPPPSRPPSRSLALSLSTPRALRASKARELRRASWVSGLGRV